jgi:hypothetical protein
MFPCLLSALLLAASSSAEPAREVSVNLRGRVPLSVTAPFVKEHYGRIWRAVAPGLPLDTSAITLVYYGRADGRKLGVRLPEWGGGGAIGKDTVIVPVDRAPLADMDVNRVTVHELVHVVLDRAYGRLPIPRWFHEGLAMTLSGELSFGEQVALSRAIFTRRLIPLDSIELVNRFDASGAALAYSESHLAVGYMIDKYAIDGIPELLAAVRAEGSFDAALGSVFGLAAAEFEALARNHFAHEFRFMFLIGDTWLFWMPASLFVIAGFIAVRLRNARRKRQMGEQEKIEDLRLQIEDTKSNTLI